MVRIQSAQQNLQIRVVERAGTLLSYKASFRFQVHDESRQPARRYVMGVRRSKPRDVARLLLLDHTNSVYRQ